MLFRPLSFPSRPAPTPLLLVATVAMPFVLALHDPRMLATLPILATLLGAASAHFQLQYPPPRGVFNEDSEPTFCGKSPSRLVIRSTRN